MQKCEVCGQEGKLATTASSLTAMSYGGCYDCFLANAEPYDIILGTVWGTGGEVEEWVEDIIEGTLKRVGKTRQELEEDVQQLEAAILKDLENSVDGLADLEADIMYFTSWLSEEKGTIIGIEVVEEFIQHVKQEEEEFQIEGDLNVL